MSAKGRRKGMALLNLWVGANEKSWLKANATREGMSVTVYLRMLVRREMDREKSEALVIELNRRVKEETGT